MKEIKKKSIKELSNILKTIFAQLEYYFRKEKSIVNHAGDPFCCLVCPRYAEVGLGLDIFTKVHYAPALGSSKVLESKGLVFAQF